MEILLGLLLIFLLITSVRHKISLTESQWRARFVAKNHEFIAGYYKWLNFRKLIKREKIAAHLLAAAGALIIKYNNLSST